jgi:hypothetical protein
MSREDWALVGMVGIRLLSSLIEFSAAILMIRFGNVRSALRINAVLGLVGQAILISAGLVGIVGLAGKIALGRTFLILGGVGLVLLGTR